MCTVTSSNLRVLGSRLSQALVSNSGRQVLLAGPVGRGKTSLIKNVIKQGTSNNLYSYYDFEENSNHNFQVMVMQWTSTLIATNPLITQASESITLDAFERFRRELPQVNQNLRGYFERIVSHKRIDGRVSTHLLHIINKTDVVDGALLMEACSMLRKHAPWTMGIKDPSAIGEGEALYHAVNASSIIAEKAELESKGEQNPSSRISGRLTTTCLLRLLVSLSQRMQKDWVVCLDGISHLCTSPFLKDRGEPFLDRLIEELQRGKISSVLISDSSTPFLKFLDVGLSNRLKELYMLPPRAVAESNAHKEPLLFLDVPEIEQHAAMALLRDKVWDSESIAKALYNVSGGNISLLSRIVSSYRKLEETLDLPAVQQILAGSENPVDDEYFPFKETVENQERYLQEERCKMFVRNLHNTNLQSEIGKFENLMNQLLSLPGMEAIKQKLGNGVHFWVTVSETIRYMLQKPIMQLKPGCAVENKIVLCLIAVGLVHLNLHSRTMEFKDALTRLLLQTYIDKEYDSLTWIQQVEYKANFLLNQKRIYRGVDEILI